MSNNKLYRTAQNRNQFSNDSTAGFLNFSGLIKELKKSQIKECEPYSMISDICRSLKIRKDKCYGKVLFTNVHGQVKLLISQGRNTDHAAASEKKYSIVANILKLKIESVSRLNKSKANSRAIDDKNKVRPVTIDKNSNSSIKSSPSSLKFRKKKRLSNYRSRLKPAKSLLKDQVTLSDFYSQSPSTPESFNAPKASIPAKDFSSIFEDANNKLYDISAEDDIEIENPPGVAKYIGLGIDIDRPNIIMSTELSPIIYDESLDVYEKLMLDRQYRLESVYDSLDNVNLEENEQDVIKQGELLAETQALIKDGLSTVKTITSLDDEIIQELSVKMYDMSQILGYSKNLKLTQIYAQVLFDIGAYSEFGIYLTEKGTRALPNTSQVTINSKYKTTQFSGKSIYNSVLSSAGRVQNARKSSAFSFGSSNLGCSYLAYQKLVDSPKNRDGQNNLGSSGIRINFGALDEVSLMQTIFTELMLSRLASDGDPNILSLKSKGSINLMTEFMGTFGNSTNSLNSIKVPEKLSSIMKFKYSGENFYPLEQFISTASSLNGRTFLDAVVQPAIGSIIESEDPNFNLLNAWVENAKSNLDDSLRYINPAIFDGGSAIILNEIILAAVKCVADKDAKIGGKKHAFSPGMIKQVDSLSSQNIAAILKYGINHFSAGSSRSLGHIYNTIGYNFFAGQDYILKSFRYVDSSGVNSGLSNSVIDSYKIGATNWDSSYSRNLSDNLIPNMVLNNIYEEYSRFFNILENGIMTSIELLLSDAGLLKASPNNNYFSEVGSFFEDSKPSTKNNDSSTGTYEKTSFSGIPRLYLRALLAKCCKKVFDTGFLDNGLNILKAAKVSVENLDIESGPVRWKVTHGEWPLESDSFEDLDPDTYNKLVPSEIKDLFESGGVDVNVNTDSDGNPESISVEDPLAQWRFIDSKEGFCPITLFLDGEDNSENNASFIRGNRAMFDNVFDTIVSNRSYLNKALSFIQSPINKFQQFPENLEEAIGNVSIDSIKEIASLPGVDGQELVKFTTVNQIANFSVTNLLESPSAGLRYLPNKLALSNNEYLVAKAFVNSYMDKNFSREDMAVVQTIGIPCGYLNANNIFSKFSITREAEYMFYPDTQWSSKTNLFNPFVYLIPGSFSQCSPGSGYEQIVQNAKYYISDSQLSTFMSFSEFQDYFQLTQEDTLKCLTNHVLDATLKMSLKITTGMDISEDTFRLNKEVNQKHVNSDGIKLIEKFINKFPAKYNDFFEKGKLKNISQILKSDSESTVLEINGFLAALDCRLITPTEITRKIFSTRLFDRVFCMFAHPDEHYSLDQKESLVEKDITIDGISRKVYQIDLKDPSFNSIKNDHLASYYYKVENQ